MKEKKFKITMRQTVYSEAERERRLLECIRLILAHREKRLSKLSNEVKNGKA